MVLQFPPADDQPVDRPAASKLKYKVVVGVGGLAGLFGIGSTLAANISLNNGGAVEFGQGVAQTAACDDDGFMVTPVTSYDNAHSMFRLDKVQVSGLNLTPVGTGFLAGGYDTIEAARAAHPGQYFDNGQWKKTCDGVVLDFKAYTNNPDYANYTQNNYADKSGTSITSPVMWSQRNGQAAEAEITYNSGFAVVFDSSNKDSNYAYGSVQGLIGNRVYDTTYSSGPGLMWVNNKSRLTTSNASFSFGSFFSNYNDSTHQSYDYRPNAATISKITVQSMKYFPANYVDYKHEYNHGSLPVPGLSLLPPA
jgi:hypothetical protein